MAGQEEPGKPRVGPRARRRHQVQRQVRRSLALTALGTVVPGAGLTRTRYRGFGWFLLGTFVTVVMVVAGFIVLKGPVNAVLDVAVRPDMLLALGGLTIIWALVWMLSIILTNRGTEPSTVSGGAHWGLKAFTALMCLAIAAPAFQVVRYAAIQRDVLGSVFAGVNGPQPSGGATGAKPQLNVADPWAGVPRVNMLLLGSDAGSDRIGTRTDSMIVASIDTKTGNTVLFGIPRNLERVPFPKDNPLYKLYPGGYWCPGAPPGEECLINAVWELAEQHKELFTNDPQPGLTTIKGVIAEVTGLRLDYTTVIDLAGFESLVNAMGGVVVDVKERLPIGGHIDANGRAVGVTEWIEPGTQRLNGFHALWYARSRILSDDYGRMRRQRCLVGTILNQVNPVTMLQKYPQLAEFAKQNIETDVAAEDLPAWVQLVDLIKKATITSLTFTSRNISPVNPDFVAIRRMIQDALSPAADSSSTPPPTPSGTSTTPPTSTRSFTKPPVKTSTSTKTTSTSPTSDPSADTLVNVKDAC